MAPVPGARFGRYELLRKLGAGGMGEVYVARDRDLRRDVAIKVLPERFARDPDRLGRFSQEARAASAFNHPSIIAIYEIGQADGLPYIAMELVEGQTLRAVLQGRPLPVRRILEIAVAVAEGLAKAHAGGIVHRDLKPENLMIASDGFVKILDFGVAKLRRDEPEGAEEQTVLPPPESGNGTRTDLPASPLTSAGVVMGTAGYMSPEQARGERVDFRSDQFSFGSILYEMASGRRAFKRESAAQTFAAVIESQPEPLARVNPELPAPLCWIVERCLAKDPADRYASTQDLARELRTVGEHLSEMRGSGPSLITRAARLPKRYRLPVALAAVTVLLGVFFLLAARQRLWAPREGLGVAKAARAGLTEKDTVVLADIENKTGDPAFDDALKQALVLDLGQSPFLDILSERKVTATLRLMGRSPEQPLTGEVARELCQRAGSKVMIAGSISALGSEYVIGLHAVNCASGDTLVSEQARASGKGDVLKALDSSASAMRTRLGESLASVQKFSAPIEEATTPSLEALKAYALGRRANNEKGDAASVPYQLRAVELDPNFAVAYASLAIAYSNLGQPGRAVEPARKAYDLRNRVSEREKYRIMAYYYMAGVGDLPKAIQACEFWKQNYPRDNIAATNLGANYMWVGQWEKAIGDTELTISLDPNGAVPYSNLAIIQLALNRYDDARATLEQAFARKIDAYFIHLDAYEEAFLRSDTQAMQRHVAAVAGRPGEEDWLISAQGDTEAYFGRARQAREFSRRAAESARLADAPEAAALWHAEAALRDAEMGHAAAAREGAVKALDLMSGRDVRSLAALALARAGDTARAQKVADRLDKEFPQNTHVQQYWLPSIRAALALDAKDAARALEILEPAKAIDLAQAGPFEFGMMYPPYLRGQAYLLARRGHEAAAEFQKLIDRPGLLKNFVLFPLARLGSARAHALEGNRERSRADYDLFLELWKTADADVPLLQEARAESARMR